ncbi:MAG: hypothetical protein SCALA702_37050 [Melioribacteraceae bacterium]|nr:MAG: hypothetical protein SCALA702_37050 [Melioribacteraceae bacterium]
MKKLFILFLFPFLLSFAQSEKVTPYLSQKAAAMDQGEKVLAWIYFTDKGNSTEKYFNNPQLVVSQKSLKRRAKVFEKSTLIDFTDLPVNENYVSALQQTGAEIRNRTRWFNGVSAYINIASIEEIATMSFVKKMDVVRAFNKNYDVEDDVSPEALQRATQPRGTHSFDYGGSFTQLNQISVPAVHDLGITGEGITVCVMDAGFNNLEHNTFNQMNILATWDFVNGDEDVDDGDDMGTGDHGTNTLSTIGGYDPGNHFGPAFGADYILAKTENNESETPIEEDHWVSAMEWADSIGVDVTSTSLGYITFDSPYPDYTWEDMDGNTTVITNGADLAAEKGIVVVNSAGNEGYDATHNTLGAPSDGDSVIAVGAVGSSGTRSSFSSVGNTVDGRIKPDIMAMGSSVQVASTFGTTGYTSSSGTSFSCPLAAGVATLVLSFNPELTPMQVRDILRMTADNADAPNREYGWGIINAMEAIMNAGTPDAIPPTTVADLMVSEPTSNTLKLTWSAPLDSSAGGVTEYDLRYSTAPITDENTFLAADQLAYGESPADPGVMETYMIEGLGFDETYYFAVRSKDFWDNWSEVSNVPEGTTLSAPDMAVTPAEINVELNPGASTTENINIANNSGSASTLDYDVVFANNTFPENAKVKAKLVPAKSAIESFGTKDDPANIHGYSIEGAGGPDLFGYEWIDSDEANGPEYEWVDISGTGTAVTNWTATGTFNAMDEGVSEAMPIGFNFKFYGEEYSEAFASTNGFITFGTISGNTYTNDEIPNSDNPNTIISALWDDLDGGNGGTVYYENMGNKFVIQYDNWGEYFGSGTFTYQVVLYSSGKIMIYYNSMSGDLTSSTVGIENASGNDGLQIAYNSAYIGAGKAVMISAEPEWLVSGNMGGRIYNGNNVDLELTFVTDELPEGFYSMDVIISSNDPDNASVTVPVTMTLGQSGTMTMNMSMAEGWNLVSVPLMLDDMIPSAVYENASSPAYYYDNGYVEEDMLTNGTGYWIKYDNSDAMSMTGTPVNQNTSLVEGWNLIGPLHVDALVSAITTVPAGIITTDFFGFNSAYYAAETLESGYGYWVKTSAAGDLMLNVSGKKGNDAEEIAEDALYTIGLSTSDGAAGSYGLMLGIDPAATDGIDSDLGETELPPLPPAGVYDARMILPDGTTGSPADYRTGDNNYTGQVTYTLKYQLGDGGTSMTLDVDIPEIPGTVTMTVQDPFGGVLVNEVVNEGGGQVVVTNTSLTELKLIVDYNAPIPVELSSFVANVVGETIQLAWETATETNNKGFEVERSEDNATFTKVGYIDGNGTTSEKQSYTFTDHHAVSGTYYYRLRQVDFDGTSSYSDAVEVDFVPTEYSLGQNYPNPFNPSTRIKFAVPVDSKVTVTLYNMLGQKVKEIVSQNYSVGLHEVDFNASELSSGMYIYSITALGVDGSNFVDTKKMMLMK